MGTLLMVSIVSAIGTLFSLSVAGQAFSVCHAGAAADRIGWMLERTPACFAFDLFVQQSADMASQSLSGFRLSKHLVLNPDIPRLAGMLMLFFHHNRTEPAPSPCF